LVALSCASSTSAVTTPPGSTFPRPVSPANENWRIHNNLVKDTESDGWPTMAEAKDFAENIPDELESLDAA